MSTGLRRSHRGQTTHLTVLILVTLTTPLLHLPCAHAHTKAGDDTPVTFLPYDVTAITLYGTGAVYQPSLCPSNITFRARARHLPALSDGHIGFYPWDIEADGHRCKAKAADNDGKTGIVFELFPIGKKTHYPPQWIFERFAKRSSDPTKLQCGPLQWSVRYGYFNDVAVDEETQLLEKSVVYFDFAVVPTTSPFSFCSYATRRADGGRPIDYAPFPTHGTWDEVRGVDGEGVLPSPSEEGEEALETPDGGALPTPAVRGTEREESILVSKPSFSIGGLFFGAELKA